MPLELITISFRKQVKECPGTVSFYFDKPEGYAYLAGQQASMVLGESLRETELVRPMSFSSHPQDDFLRFTMHVDSGSVFKRKLLGLTSGDSIRITPPRGQFTWSDDSAGRVYWLAGGVGITPFASMLRGLGEAERARVALYHIAREYFPLEADYVERLETYKQANFTEMESDLRASKERLASGGGRFYISGSPKFVEAVEEILLDIGVAGERIVLDTFKGYEELLNS